MKVGIALPTLSIGDAVGNDVMGMSSILRQRGYDVEYFAWNSNGIQDKVRPFNDMAKILRSSEDIYIYHHSIGCEPAVKALERLPCRRKAVKYHNVTPPEFFEKTNPKVAEGCREGIRQLGRIAKSTAHIWADSEYNARDIRGLAPIKQVTELPPFHQADELFSSETDCRAALGLDDWNTNILLVGRIVPNKNIPLAVEAFAEYRATYDRSARLILAGSWPLADHTAEVVKTIKRLGQESHTLMTGSVSVAQLKALYLTSDLLLVTSRHEGFCVPVVEAMGLGIPVVAVPNAAVPFTGGDAARYTEDSPAMIAAEIQATIADSTGREQLICRGRARFEERFSNKAIGQRFETLLDQLLES